MTERAFDKLEYSEFLFRLGMIGEYKAEEIRNQLTASAFTAWQLNGIKITFQDYLKKMGLGEKEIKLSKEEKEIITQRSISLAEKIKAADQKR